MAKSTKNTGSKGSETIVRIVGSEESNVQTDENEADPDELRAIAELNSGSGVKWSVHRVSSMGGKEPGYCGSLTTAELSMERLATEWGVGRYRVRGTRDNGTFAGQSTVTVAEAPRLPAAQAVAPASTTTSVQDYIALMEQRDERSSRNMREWAAILAPLAVSILPNLFKGSSGPTLAELTTTLQNMKTLSGQGESAASKITELKEMLEVVRGLDPPDKTGSTWVDLVRDTVKEVGAPLMAMVGARTGQPIPAPRVAAAAPIDANGNPQLIQAPAPSGEPMLQLMAWLKDQLAALTHQASLNKDPDLYAEVVVDNLPAGVDPKLLRDQLARPDWWAVMGGFYPGVQPYPQWFAECRESILTRLNEMIGAPEIAPPPASGKPPKKKIVVPIKPMPADHGETNSD